MNILVVSTERYRLNGISNVIKNLYRNKMFSKHKLVFLLPVGSDDSMIAELKDMNFNVILSKRNKKTIASYYNQIKKIIKSENIDILHLHGGIGALIGALEIGRQVIAVPRLAKYDEHIDDHQTQVAS